MLVTFHIVLCVFLVLVILLQAGKSGGFTTSFGGGSQSLFGSTGAGNFLTKATTTVAVLFFITSIMLTIAVTRESSTSILKDQTVETPSPNTTETDGTTAAPTDSTLAPPATDTESAPTQETP